MEQKKAICGALGMLQSANNAPASQRLNPTPIVTVSPNAATAGVLLNASRAVASGFMLNGMIVLAKGADYTVFCNGQPENACALPAYVGAASRCRAIQVFRLPIEVC